jgi:hypothetical protein
MFVARPALHGIAPWRPRQHTLRMWEPILWLALLVAAWRWLLVRPGLDDNGLGTYTMVIPRESERAGEPSEDPI